MIENYDGLEWDIDEYPCQSSTPDEFYENSYRATAICPDCGNKISGMANYWSRYEDMSMAWLNSIDHDECDCQSEEYEEEDEWSDVDEDQLNDEPPKTN